MSMSIRFGKQYVLAGPDKRTEDGFVVAKKIAFHQNQQKNNDSQLPDMVFSQVFGYSYWFIFDGKDAERVRQQDYFTSIYDDIAANPGAFDYYAALRSLVRYPRYKQVLDEVMNDPTVPESQKDVEFQMHSLQKAANIALAEIEMERAGWIEAVENNTMERFVIEMSPEEKARRSSVSPKTFDGPHKFTWRDYLPEAPGILKTWLKPFQRSNKMQQTSGKPGVVYQKPIVIQRQDPK